MRRRLFFLLVLMTATPLGLLVGLTTKLAGDARARAALQVEQVLRGRLSDLHDRVTEVLAQRRRATLTLFDQLTAQEQLTPARMRAALLESTGLRQLYLRAPKGRLTFPDPAGPLSDSEREALVRTREVWNRGALSAVDTSDGEAAPKDPRSASPQSGWYAWYWQDGLQLMVWRRTPAHGWLVAELDRARLMADLIAALPSTQGGLSSGTDHLPSPGDRDYRVRLLDARDQTVYQWGSFEIPDGQAPLASIALGPPLGAWRLEYLMAPAAYEALVGQGFPPTLWLGLVAVGLAIAGLGLFFYRESRRDQREARQRVTFVNQVSHELKTPLTNIRMYAELLERDLEGMDGAGIAPERPGSSDGPPSRVRRNLSVIIEESQRLSRLISNVLTFGRDQRHALRVHRTPGSLEETVDAVIEQFRPVLRARGLEVHRQGSAPGRVWFDGDAVGQILANLIGNVEKYAATGGRLDVSVRIEEAGREPVAIITVRDYGPGVPEGEQERVFQPFFRLDSKLTEGVSGAGIGLALVRRLADLHGGEARCRSPGAGPGVCFEIILAVGEPSTD